MNAVTEVKADHKSIFAALAAAQMEMGPALKDSANPAFRSKYADLASVMQACMGALNKHGICVMQPTGEDETGRYVKTILAHTTGETVECRVPLIVGKNDMQGYGSAVTYARRYGLMSMAGIAPEDDDGNAAAKNVQSSAISQARDDGVLDGLPENASPREKAEAYAKAICADFSGKGVKALDRSWDNWQKHIAKLQDSYPDLWSSVVDAFETRKNELTEGRMAAE